MTTDRDIVELNMTMPHLMNCGHSETGWCLGCVKEQWEEECRWRSRVAERDATITALRAEVEHVNAANQSMLLVIEKQNRNATALRAEVERLNTRIGNWEAAVRGAINSLSPTLDEMHNDYHGKAR